MFVKTVEHVSDPDSVGVHVQELEEGVVESPSVVCVSLGDQPWVSLSLEAAASLYEALHVSRIVFLPKDDPMRRPSPRNFANFVEHRLEHFRDRGPMWGDPEAVEMQAIQLIEIEARLAGVAEDNAREPLETYVKRLRRTYPEDVHGSKPLFQLVTEEKEFGRELFRICQETRRKLGLIPRVVRPNEEPQNPAT